ncbi:hypothetical protein GCM10009504_41300 [Pseudomonas laurentiana]|uniref:hypothetical protein n=1 Tax=Pseudomonas laurentiana TaxID=2364649 RepID=UPI00198479F3|nr:hypothetical protein [Pseudomonas laurentiana]GGU80066.1 hypothetical protein GCM10009504_41300 [Pseudomonas laurentiana]
MVGVTGYTSFSSTSVLNRASPSQPVGTDDTTRSVAVIPAASDASTVSTLARQLSEAAVRAEARDAGLDYKALGEAAKVLLNQISGVSYTLNKARHDAELPNSDDPELLERARQATDFVNSRYPGSNIVGKNPFEGMSRDQLALIAYDDSGAFTVNERRAALYETQEQEYEWRRMVLAKGDAEYNSTGKLTDFFTEVLEHYEGLPAIEQAQYPGNYVSQLQGWIDSGFNYITHQAEGKGTTLVGLLDEWMTSASSQQNDATDYLSARAGDEAASKRS